MCLALPAQVIALHDDQHATVDLGGVRRKVNVMLVDNLAINDYVLLHVGFAIAKLSPDEAQKTLALIDEATRSARPAD
ncbi:MAG TPA: HypC/HybG/HupF family hydrogenase formation chaperone [Pseudomonadota bacterium]|jgi:hydrogenase expression/formation protein HypC|nr:HypC/HybG/HupF family hydrogenase formation chaperone [Pseudomonadota bacterium]HNI58323.1 HypC/HybG/HupF family hydrogenase formation chaperone [Pseudomonadota bacterium]HNN50704.1 HypC/HybG/HupF family hydrogenase formation chaperone [Pseudomonadota bacterium]HNO68915.1 HypC/HybG/HupF family hydrogenase formation chaperone [Pseudomonadota bacterium]